jgi:hypothetical protein
MVNPVLATVHSSSDRPDRHHLFGQILSIRNDYFDEAHCKQLPFSSSHQNNYQYELISSFTTYSNERDQNQRTSPFCWSAPQGHSDDNPTFRISLNDYLACRNCGLLADEITSLTRQDPSHILRDLSATLALPSLFLRWPLRTWLPRALDSSVLLK